MRSIVAIFSLSSFDSLLTLGPCIDNNVISLNAAQFKITMDHRFTGNRATNKIKMWTMLQRIKSSGIIRVQMPKTPKPNLGPENKKRRKKEKRGGSGKEKKHDEK